MKSYTLAEEIKMEERRLKRQIVWKNHKPGFIRKIQYDKRNKVINLYTWQDNKLAWFYDIDTEGMTRSKAQDWFWHMCGKIWMQDTPGAMTALRGILRDVLTIQK